MGLFFQVLSINISCCVLFNVTMAQYDNLDFNHIQNSYKNPVNLFQQYPSQLWNLQDNLNYEDYNYYDEENVCSCEDCDNLKSSCQNMCPNCARPPSFLSNPGYVFLPFPYPYPMVTKTTAQPKKSTKATTTPTTKTTTKTVTTITSQKSTKETELTFDEQTDATITDKLVESKVSGVAAKSLEVKDKSPYMLTSLRRTKTNWIPKYGIVPISNKFAEKLMLQLRNMKVLHSPKDYLRDVDKITPY
ncbi:unnamed protein product [Euphydryas editha]|uniref:Uncharacterized protein n=1 Tax=Euphydryas editha TaxID=104508 RepID=A0AAU9U8W0_EUPED|nr:unnamed protein product [Euphydryas editha]